MDSFTSQFEEKNVTINFIVGKTSMFEVFEEIKESAKTLHDKDHLIFMHNDAFVLSHGIHVQMVIHELLDKEDTGFVGVAGARKLKKSAVWWDGFQQSNPNDSRSNTMGMIYHGDSEHLTPTYYGSYGECQVVDGVFMAFTKKVLDKISLKKPQSFSGDWDFYDIYFSFQAVVHGFKNYVAPITVLHESTGQGALEEGWQNNRLSFIDKFGKFLT